MKQITRKAPCFNYAYLETLGMPSYMVPPWMDHSIWVAFTRFCRQIQDRDPGLGGQANLGDERLWNRCPPKPFQFVGFRNGLLVFSLLIFPD